MHKLRYIYGMLLLILVTTVSAQLPAEQNNKAGFRKSAYGGIIMHTQGLGLNLYFSKFKTADTKTLFSFDIVSMKHSKEVKSFGVIDENAKGFVYGKLNSLYIIRFGYGRKKILHEKLREQAVEISYVWMAGPSIGMAKPVYLEVFNIVGEIIQVERYDPEKHNLSNIFGRGPASRGVSEMKFYPGAFLKLAVTFEYSTYRSGIKAIEVGGVLDAYPQKIPIMTNTKNNFLYPSLYINLLIGKKYF